MVCALGAASTVLGVGVKLIALLGKEQTVIASRRVILYASELIDGTYAVAVCRAPSRRELRGG